MSLTPIPQVTRSAAAGSSGSWWFSTSRMSEPDTDKLSTRQGRPVRRRSTSMTWPTYPPSGVGAPSPCAVESPSTTHSGPGARRTCSLCACQWQAKATQSARIAVTPSAHRPNGPARSPETSAAWVRVRYVPMVATISTGERRPASPVPADGLRRASRETAGIRSMRRPPSTFTRAKRR